MFPASVLDLAIVNQPRLRAVIGRRHAAHILLARLKLVLFMHVSRRTGRNTELADINPIPLEVRHKAG